MPFRRHLPDPRRWATQFLLVALEAIVGRRPPAQLGQWATPSAVAGVRDAAVSTGQRLPTALGAIRTPSMALHSVHVAEPSDGAAEVCAVIRRGERYRALAARLENHDGRWRCVSFQLL